MKSEAHGRPSHLHPPPQIGSEQLLMHSTGEEATWIKTQSRDRSEYRFPLTHRPCDPNDMCFDCTHYFVLALVGDLVPPISIYGRTG